MVFLRGNLALRDHSENGEEVHLFEQVSGGLRYDGEMVCAGYYERDDVPDRNGDLRRAIVFELVAPDDGARDLRATSERPVRARLALDDAARRAPRPRLTNGRASAERERGKASHLRAQRGPARVRPTTRRRPMRGMRHAGTVPHDSRAPLPRAASHEAPLRRRARRLPPRHRAMPDVPPPRPPRAPTATTTTTSSGSSSSRSRRRLSTRSAARTVNRAAASTRSLSASSRRRSRVSTGRPRRRTARAPRPCSRRA